MSIEITWEVEDGYSGKSRPQSTYIDFDEINECENEEAVRQLVDDYVSEDFSQKVSWSVRDSSYKEAIAAWKEAKEVDHD